MEEIFNQYLNRLIKFRIYPFAPLEINFLIDCGWVVIRSLFKGFFDYRVTREGRQGGGSGFFLFAEMRIAIFIFSFLVTFSISLSLDFWFTLMGISKNKFIWWLPSTIAISLAETSGLITRILPEKEEEGELLETVEIRKISHLSVYFSLVFLSLVIFWLIMGLKYVFLT